jgi:hypothetical protein
MEVIQYHIQFGGIIIKRKLTMILKRIFFIILMQQLALIYCNVKAENLGSEIAYLQTDRAAYIAGESIFYKLYVLDGTTKKRSVMSKVGYIILRTTNSDVTLKFRVNVNAGMAHGSLALPDTLTTGVYQIVAFTSSMRNRGNDYLFHKVITVVNRFDKALDFKLIQSTSQDTLLSRTNQELKIKTDKSLYNCREKVVVHLGSANSKANVSVTVFEESIMPSVYKSIVQVFNDSAMSRNNKRIVNYYSPETNGKILRGCVVDAKSKQKIENAIVLLSCLDTIPNLEYALTNSNGLFQIMLSDYYNGKELFLTIKDVPDNRNWEIKMEDEFAQTEKWNPLLIPVNKDQKEFIGKSQNLVYINKAYQLDKKINGKPESEPKLICPRFYNCPVMTVLPSDFVPLDSFPEIAVELLPQLRVIKDKGKYHVQMIDEIAKGYQKQDPAIFLDGVYVDDVNKIIGLGSEQIKKIDMITPERAFGDLVFSGVISITSKANEMMHSKPAPYSIRIKNDNINSGANLVPDNSFPNENTPFLRQLLYWNPNLEVNLTEDTHFEFYTSENQAKFSIKVEGVSEDGTPISASSTIQVANQINVTDK